MEFELIPQEFIKITYQQFANITYYMIGVIVLQMIGSGIVKVDENFTVKTTIGGDTKFQKTSRLVISVLLVVFGYYFYSQIFDDYAKENLLKLEYLLIPLFFALTSFFVCYLLKINIRRCWDFPLVRMTLLPLFAFSIILGVLWYYFPPFSLSN